MNWKQNGVPGDLGGQVAALVAEAAAWRLSYSPPREPEIKH